jgi:hypothetical protein
VPMGHSGREPPTAHSHSSTISPTEQNGTSADRADVPGSPLRSRGKPGSENKLWRRVAIAHYLIGTLAFFTLWYLSFAWFVIDRNQAPKTAGFWTRDVQLRDLAREAVSVEDISAGPIRTVSYPRLAFGVLLSALPFALIAGRPVRGRWQAWLLTCCALIAPYWIVWMTYLDLPSRFIPFLWGMLIGYSSVLVALKQTAVPSQIKRFLGGKCRAIIVGSLLVLLASLPLFMLLLGINRPVDWFGWCVGVAVFGTTWTLFGFRLADVV